MAFSSCNSRNFGLPSQPHGATYQLKFLRDLNAVLYSWIYVHIRRASPRFKCVYSQLLWPKIQSSVGGRVTSRSQGIPDILMRFIWTIHQRMETIAVLSVRVDALLTHPRASFARVGVLVFTLHLVFTRLLCLCRPPLGGGAGENPPGQEPWAGAGPAADVLHQP